MDQRAPISFHKTVDREKIGYLVSKNKCLHGTNAYILHGSISRLVTKEPISRFILPITLAHSLIINHNLLWLLLPWKYWYEVMNKEVNKVADCGGNYSAWKRK